MELKSVKLYNVSSYAGEAAFDLSTDGGRTIILIGGSNGAGKTSLFTAIKLALYGPLCFRYQGKNAQYSARLKELMNHDAFTEPEVRTYVEAEVMLPVGQSGSVYTVHREWIYTGQRIRETYWVRDASGLLSPRDKDYFQNYLFTVIPPNLFEFFFFDGEEISNFFSDASYNTYIKNAVLTLCGYDTFGLIKKFCDTYVGGDSSDAEYRRLLGDLRGKEEELEKPESGIAAAETALEKLEEKKAAALDEKESLEAQFKASGGLRKDERDILHNQLRRYDQEKEECAKQIRTYTEGLMPFYIAYSLSRELQEQLSREEQMRQYLASTCQLSEAMLEEAVSRSGFVPADQAGPLSRHLYESISSALRPEGAPEEFTFLHDLSGEQRDQVSSTLTELSRFNPRKIIQAIGSKKKRRRPLNRCSANCGRPSPASTPTRSWSGSASCPPPSRPIASLFPRSRSNWTDTTRRNCPCKRLPRPCAAGSGPRKKTRPLTSTPPASAP